MDAKIFDFFVVVFALLTLLLAGLRAKASHEISDLKVSQTYEEGR